MAALASPEELDRDPSAPAALAPAAPSGVALESSRRASSWLTDIRTAPSSSSGRMEATASRDARTKAGSAPGNTAFTLITARFST
jgi:hypothetical protein